MTTTLRARFDGKVLVPESAVELSTNQRYELKITPIVDESDVGRGSVAGQAPNMPHAGLRGLAKLAEELSRLPQNPDAPTDGAAQHDHYLYGTPKRNNS